MSYETYHAVRERILNAAARRIPKASAASQARALGLWGGKEMRYANEAQLQLVMDLGVFGPVGGHSRALDRQAQSGDHAEGSEEAHVLAALSRAHFTLFRIDAAHPEGGVAAEDLLRGTPLRIKDQMLAREEVQGNAYAGRLMHLDGYEMTCGAVAPLTDEVIEALLGRSAAILPTPAYLPALTPLTEADVVSLRAAAMAEDFPARVYRASLDHGLFGRLPQ